MAYDKIFANQIRERPMKGYVMVDGSGMQRQTEFDYWIELALDFNKRAVSSKRKKK